MNDDEDIKFFLNKILSGAGHNQTAIGGGFLSYYEAISQAPFVLPDFSAANYGICTADYLYRS
jgi:hypothetical protein